MSLASKSIFLSLCVVTITACQAAGEKTPEMVAMEQDIKRDINFQEFELTSASHPQLCQLKVSSLDLRQKDGIKDHLVTIQCANGDAFPEIDRDADDARVVSIVREFASQKYCLTNGVDSIARSESRTRNFGMDATHRQTHKKYAYVKCRR